MSDIVERLREAHKRGPHIMNDFRIFNEAADEIGRLTAALEERVKDVMPASAQLLNITKAALDNAEAEIERLQEEVATMSGKDHEKIMLQQREIERLTAEVAHWKGFVPIAVVRDFPFNPRGVAVNP